ncbi:LptF/LptG family permease [Pelagibacterales bacterium SAG-MED23]|nr:LptF/LptG family permease [Pelagibacterales bacterium SAG-MED23]
MIKKYESYLTKLFLKNILIIVTVFIFLSFFLNIFEEIKYFENKESNIYYPVILTILNIPSIIFEILPFIFLLGVMFFFISLYDKDEIELLRSNGIDNIKITSIISIVSLLMGIILIVFYYSFSANLKSLYLDTKYKYSNKGDHLAVVNEDGLWIKEKSSDNKQIFIINAKNYKINFLEDLEITRLNLDYNLINTIVSKKADIKSKQWVLSEVKVYSNKKKTEFFDNYKYLSSFNEEIISNLYSNLNSLNILQLIKLKDNYKSIGYSATEVSLHLNKIYSLPIYLTLTTIIGALLMFKITFIKSKFFLIVIGVLVSVIFYYINYFSILFGKNETLPVVLSVWLPQILIFLLCALGLTKLNEN